MSRLRMMAVVLLATQALANAQCPEKQRLVASDGARDDHFGWGMDLDKNVAIVGALYNDTNVRNEGAAYVFRRDSRSSPWIQEARLLLAPGTDNPDDYFGYAVAVDDDTIMVSALGDDVGTESNAGVVYVFNYAEASGQWTRGQTLTASDPKAGDQFGIHIALEGDWAIIGANTRDSRGALDSGAAYVFRRGAFDIWTEQQILEAPLPADNDYAGHRVALNGHRVAMAAAWTDVNRLTDAGVVHIFERHEETWSFSETITHPTPSSGDLFGSDVSLCGDTMLVGCRLEDHVAQDAGAAHTFEIHNNAFQHSQRLIASNPGADDRYGTSVALTPVLAVVGAPRDEFGRGVDSGSAYAYSYENGQWKNEIMVSASDASSHDRFGEWVRAEDSCVLVGARLNDVAATDSGSAYTYDLAELTLTANLGVARPDDFLQFKAYCGPAGKLASLWVVGLNGIPVYLPVFIGFWSQNSDFCLGDSVPPGVPPGLVATFRAIGQNIFHDAVQSSPVDITFQD